MKETYVSQLAGLADVTDYFLVKQIAVRLGSNRKQYLDITLGDPTGEVSGKKWDLADSELPALSEIQPGDIVKIRANVTEWNGLTQLRIMRIRKASDEDGLDARSLVRAAPEDGADMYDYIYQKAEQIGDGDLSVLCRKLLSENRDRLLYYPAAQKNHHAEMGGLLYHMKRMLMTGERLCEVYTNLDRDLLTAGVIVHDIEKLNEIESNEYGMSPGYSFEGELLGHIVQGIKTIDAAAVELGMPYEKRIMLEHMILSHHYEPEFGSPKRPLFPEAEALHYLDMIDAKMYDMEFALKATRPGEFSERVRTLDGRRLYRRLDDGAPEGGRE